MPPKRLALLLLVPIATAGTFVGAAVSGPAANAAVTIDGPDVSSYQHPNGASINWAAVAKAGHEFAIVKATEGTNYVNSYFAADYAGIRKAGMVRGSYHFARPARPVASSALAQAKFYVSHIGATNTTATLPPALDLEVTGGLPRVELITWAQDFLLDVRSLTGRTPMLYTYPYFWSSTLGDSAAFARYPLWMAAYSGGVNVGATLWQYTAGATVTGIKGKVDMSKLLADPSTWAAISDGSKPTPWPATAPGVPASVHVSPGVHSAVVSWLPADAGSSALSGYTVSVARADGTGTAKTVAMSSTTVSTTVGSLTAAVPYVVTVRARNAVGSGTASSAKTVVPQFPTAATSSGPGLIAYGSKAALSAVFTRADTHAPLVGVPVTVYARAHGASTWTSYGSLVTDATGRVNRVFTPGRNDDFRFRYGGTSGVAPVEVQRTVLVRPVVSATLSSSSTAVQHSVVMSGTASPVVPGLRVVSEVFSGGHWRILQAKTLGTHGGFSFVLTTFKPGYSTYRVVVAAMSSRVAGASRGLTLHTG